MNHENCEICLYKNECDIYQNWLKIRDCYCSKFNDDKKSEKLLPVVDYTCIFNIDTFCPSHYQRECLRCDNYPLLNYSEERDKLMMKKNKNG